MLLFATTGRRQHGANKTVLSVGNPSSNPRRASVFFIELSSRDTPVDQAINFDVRRCTALGTSTAVTPTKFDEAGEASLMVSGENHSVEPTYTSAKELIDTSFNLKSTYRFQTAPEWGFIIPATASNGIGVELLAASSGTPNIESTIHFSE
jgi:hypothetical protein